MTLKRKELERHQTESEENKHETHEFTHTKVKNEKGKSDIYIDKWYLITTKCCKLQMLQSIMKRGFRQTLI